MPSTTGITAASIDVPVLFSSGITRGLRLVAGDSPTDVSGVVYWFILYNQGVHVYSTGPKENQQLYEGVDVGDVTFDHVYCGGWNDPTTVYLAEIVDVSLEIYESTGRTLWRSANIVRTNGIGSRHFWIPEHANAGARTGSVVGRYVRVTWGGTPGYAYGFGMISALDAQGAAIGGATGQSSDASDKATYLQRLVDGDPETTVLRLVFVAGMWYGIQLASDKSIAAIQINTLSTTTVTRSTVTILDAALNVVWWMRLDRNPVRTFKVNVLDGVTVV